MKDAMEIVRRTMAAEPLFQQRNVVCEGCHLEHYRCYVDARVLPATQKPIILIHIGGTQVSYQTSDTDQIATSSSGLITLITGQQQTNWQANGPVNFICITAPDDISKKLLEKIDAPSGSISFSDAISYSLAIGLLAQLSHQNTDAKYTEFLLQSLFTQLQHCVTKPTMLGEDSREINSQAIDTALQYIDRNLGEILAVETLAGVANMSSSHFRDCFVRIVGTSPHQYILRRRLQRAEFLLLQRALPLSVIASDLGFSSQSHFSSCFKKQYGVAPSRFNVKK